jgi:hypothetical protein
VLQLGNLRLESGQRGEDRLSFVASDSTNVEAIVAVSTERNPETRQNGRTHEAHQRRGVARALAVLLHPRRGRYIDAGH